KPGVSLNCPVLAKQPSKSSVTSLQNAPLTPVHFNSGRSQRKRKHCGPTSQHMAALCRSIWLEVIGAEKKSYMIWIFWWRQRIPRTLRNSSFPIRSWNRLSRRDPPNRACDCGRECSATCEWLARRNILSRSLISLETKNTTSNYAAVRSSEAGRLTNIGSLRFRWIRKRKRKDRLRKFQRCTMKPAFITQSISILFCRSYGRIGVNSKPLRSIRCQNSLRRKTYGAHFIV